MQDIEHLRQQLNQRFALRQQRGSSEPQLQQQLSDLRQRLSPPRGHHALPRIAQGVLAFRIQGRETPYPHLKYACYGVARPTDWNNRLIIEDTQLFDTLLSAVITLKKTHPPAFSACCNALQVSQTLDLPNLEARQSIAIRQNSQKLADFCTLHPPQQ